MFIRRKPHSKLRHVKEIFWPSMGWRRAFRYVRHRIIRLSDTTHKIAIGLACGAAISFSPLMGTHFIQAGLLAWLLRGNVLAALIGTFIGNPWTFPFIWWGSISFGSMIMGLLGVPASAALPDNMSFSVFWDIVTNHPVRLFLPWMLGGHILGFIAFFPTYGIYYYLVSAAKLAKSKARLRKVHKVAREVTGQSQ